MIKYRPTTFLPLLLSYLLLGVIPSQGTFEDYWRIDANNVTYYIPSYEDANQRFQKAMKKLNGHLLSDEAKKKNPTKKLDLMNGFIKDIYKDSSGNINQMYSIDNDTPIIPHLIFKNIESFPYHLDLTKAKDLNGFNDISQDFIKKITTLSLPFLNKEDIIPWEKLLNVNRLNIKGMIPSEWIGNIDWVTLTYLSIDLSESKNIEEDLNTLIALEEPKQEKYPIKKSKKLKSLEEDAPNKVILPKEANEKKKKIIKNIELPQSFEDNGIIAKLEKKGYIINALGKARMIKKLIKNFSTGISSSDDDEKKEEDDDEKYEQLKKKIITLIKKGADVNAKDEGKNSPLYVACLSNNIKILNLLKKYGANLEEKDKFGSNLLHQICELPKLELRNAAKFLVENEVDVNEKNKVGNSPLYVACMFNNLNMLNFLEEYGANLEEKDEFGSNLLHKICEFPNFEKITAIIFLIDSGADVNAKDNSGMTPLQHLIFNYLGPRSYGIMVKIADYLIKNGSDVNEKDEWGNTPLHYAAQKGYIELVKYLVGQGADMKIKDKLGETPLHYAVKEGNIELVKYFVGQGDKVNKKYKNGENLLHFLPKAYHRSSSEAAKVGMVEIATYFIREGIKVNAKDNDGKTPLHWAVRFGNMEFIGLFVGNNANVNAEDGKGMTPLHCNSKKLYYCSEEIKVKIANYLIDHYANVNARDRWGSTPLHNAAERVYAVLTKTLVLQGAKINAKNKYIETPLHSLSRTLSDKTEIEATTKSRMEMASCLIAHGADTEIKDERGNTPLYDAAKKGDIRLVKKLFKEGAKVNAGNKYGLRILDFLSDDDNRLGCTEKEKEMINYLKKNDARGTFIEKLSLSKIIFLSLFICIITMILFIKIRIDNKRALRKKKRRAVKEKLILIF